MRVAVNAVSINYEVRGKEGPNLIMLHGNGEDHGIFERAAELLERHFVVYLPDTRGHGDSSAPQDEEYHYQDFADDLYEFITELDIADPIICGFSDGGITALMFASQHPDIPARIFACGANTKPSALKGLYMTRIRHKRNPTPLERLMLTEPNITAEDLSRIECPTTIVVGDRDCIKKDDTKFIVDNVRNSKLCIMRHADHSSYISHSTRIADTILQELGINTTDA